MSAPTAPNAADLRAAYRLIGRIGSALGASGDAQERLARIDDLIDAWAEQALAPRGHELRRTRGAVDRSGS